jgi:diguanylate cyclase (GGDEF)-like protein/PAS domain S-box-containing protein
VTSLDPGLSLDDRSVLDLLPIGVVVCDLDGTIGLANRVAETLLSGGAGLVGRSCWNLVEVSGGHLPMIDRARRAAAAGRITAVEAVGDSLLDQHVRLPVSITIRAMADDDRLVVTIRPVGEEVRQAVRLRATEDRFERLATAVPAGILSSEFGMRVDFANERAAEIFGVPAADLLGFGWLEHLEPDGSVDAEDAVGAVLSSGASTDLMVQVRQPNGRCRQVLIRVSAAGNLRDIGFVATVEDVTDTESMAEQLVVQARQDPLTGLANRSAFWAELGEALRVDAAQPAVLFIDLDDFKNINDSLGHTAGDHLLNIIAERVVRCARSSDMVARFGGDEFVVLLRDVPDRSVVDGVASRVLAAISEPAAIADTEAVVTGSVGIVWPDGVDDGETLDVETIIRDADIALYQAKRLGKNRAERFDESLRDGAQRRIGIAAALRRAISADTGEITVHYQPIVDLAEGRLVGMEALARWCHPEMGPIAPNDFIPVAEETGMITPLARLVLRRALEPVAEWRSLPGAERLFVAVNMSALDLAEPALARDVAAALIEHGLPGEALHLELTESAVMADPDQALCMLDALKELGPSIAIDDFGTGYSSLAYLHRLPVDTIKIDREFVNALDDESTALIEAIVALAGALGLPVVAEGVETIEQADILTRLGVPLAQGFLFSRPVPRAEIDALVALLAPPAMPKDVTPDQATDLDVDAT